MAVFNAGIFQTLGRVILLLVIEPAASVVVGVISPLEGIGQAIDVEFVRPHQGPARLVGIVHRGRSRGHHKGRVERYWI